MDNDAQCAFWNGEAGASWVRQQAAYDSLMQPVLDCLLALAALPPGTRVLDIGCGTGQGTARAAGIVGETGQATGVDISVPMLALAAERLRALENVTLIEADAAAHDFPAHAFDHAISRFGVMFFADTTAAFSKIRYALVSGGTITFATWGEIGENPWFTLPARAAKAVLGAPPAVDADAPGPFALRDRARTAAMLADAGFAQIVATATDLMLTPAGTLTDVASFATATGPANRTIEHFGAAAPQIARVEAELKELLAPFQTADGLRIPARINLFQARA